MKTRRRKYIYSKEYIGKRFGKLVGKSETFRIAVSVKGHSTREFVTCECDCGKIKDIRTDGLKSGGIVSCGCVRNEKFSKLKLNHGCATRGTKEYAVYSSWQHMKDRCLNTKNKYYKNYGGRGITICEEWKTFENFLKDMGISTKGYTIDRIDNELGYNKENCKWASKSEQNNNTSRSVYFEYNNKKQTVADWSREWNITYDAARYRIRKLLK